VILSEQGVVTEEALTAYLQNKLSPEKATVGKTVAGRPFCPGCTGRPAKLSESNRSTYIYFGAQ